MPSNEREQQPEAREGVLETAAEESVEAPEALATRLEAEADTAVEALAVDGERTAAAIAEAHGVTVPTEVRDELTALTKEAAAAKQDLQTVTAEKPKEAEETFPPIVEAFAARIGHPVSADLKRELVTFVEERRRQRAEPSKSGLTLPEEEAMRRELIELGFTTPPPADVLERARAARDERIASGEDDLDWLASLEKRNIRDLIERGKYVRLFALQAAETGSNDIIGEVERYIQDYPSAERKAFLEPIAARLVERGDFDTILKTATTRMELSPNQRQQVIEGVLAMYAKPSPESASISRLGQLLDSCRPSAEQAVRIVDTAETVSPLDGWRILLRSQGNLPFEIIQSRLGKQATVIEGAYPGGATVARIIRQAVESPDHFEMFRSDISIYDSRFRKMAEDIKVQPALVNYIPVADAIHQDIANRSLREDLQSMLFRDIDAEADPLKKPVLGVNPERVPKDMHHALGLYRHIGLAPKDIERLGASLYTGKALKQGSTKERFTSFVLDATHHGDAGKELKVFFETVLPVVETCKTAKAKVVDLAGVMRSSSSLDRADRHRIAAVSAEIQRIMDQAPAVPNDLDPRARAKAETEREARVGAELDRLIETGRTKLVDTFRTKLRLRDEITPTQTEHVIETFSDPSILFTYASKLERKGRQTELYRRFLIDVAGGKFPESRYTSYRQHLDRVFQNQPQLEVKWRETMALEGIQTGEAGRDEEQAERIRTIIRGALFNDHVPADTRATVESFMNGNTEERPQILKRIRTFTGALARGREPGDAEETMRTVAELKDAEMLIQLLEAAPQDIAMGKIKGKGGDIPIETVLDRLAKRYPNESAFGNDIEAIRTALATRPIGEAVPMSFSVSESENPDELMRMGTDVDGSCQNIEGDPDLNKNLISYVMDGKIKMLVARNAEERMIGRTLLRILYDEDDGMPILHLEESYHRAGTPIEAVGRKLLELAKNKAKHMGLRLVVSGRAQKFESTAPYSHKIHSYGGPGDTEYVDNIGGAARNGAYQIHAKQLELVAT